MSKTAVWLDFEKSLGPWVGRTSKVVDYYIQEAIADRGLDITKEQMIVLKKLHEQDGLNQNELATLTYRDKSSLARLLAKMEKKGYLKRHQNEMDKRINEVLLTDKGRQIFQESRPVIVEILEIMERNLAPEDIQQAIKTLKQVQNNFASLRLTV